MVPCYFKHNPEWCGTGREVGEEMQHIFSHKKYISKTLNPSMSDLREAQSAVHIQLKPCKQRNQLHQEKIGNGQVKGQGPSIKYTTSYTLQNSLTQSLSLSLSISPHNTHLLFSLLLTDQQYRQYRFLLLYVTLRRLEGLKSPTTPRLLLHVSSGVMGR